MKIVTPLSNANQYEELVAAGADEFYCGYIPYGWLKSFNNVLPINRREFLMTDANICTISEMKILRKKADKMGIPIKITLNSHCYISKQYEPLAAVIKQLIDLGYDTFIIADPALIVYLREKGIHCVIHLSSEVGEINRLSIQFFEKYDIKRYIFTRKNSIEDMKSCIDHCENKQVEFEAFILNELCMFTGAFCNSLHTDELPNICDVPFVLTRTDTVSSNADIIARGIQKVNRLNKIQSQKSPAQTINPMGINGCGICRVKKLMDAGVTYLKVVGRGSNLAERLNDISNLKKVIEAAKQYHDPIAFENMIKSKYFPGGCPKAFCYYR